MPTQVDFPVYNIVIYIYKCVSASQFTERNGNNLRSLGVAGCGELSGGPL